MMILSKSTVKLQDERVSQQVVWYATPCSWVSGSRRFERTYNTTESLQLLVQLRSVI